MNSYKKRKIPQKLRIEVWKKYNGDSFSGFCYSCKDSLRFENFHAGHVIAEINGGETTLNNLFPVCSSCNISCGRKNLEEFKEVLQEYKRKLLCKGMGRGLGNTLKTLKEIPKNIREEIVKKGKNFYTKHEGALYDIEIERYSEAFCCFAAEFYVISVYIWSA